MDVQSKSTKVIISQLESGDIAVHNSDRDLIVGITFQNELKDWDHETKLKNAVKMLRSIGMEICDANIH